MVCEEYTVYVDEAVRFSIKLSAPRARFGTNAYKRGWIISTLLALSIRVLYISILRAQPVFENTWCVNVNNGTGFGKKD